MTSFIAPWWHLSMDADHLSITVFISPYLRLMFVPKLFRIEDHQAIEDFIRQNSFATLVSSVEGKPWATHLPLELEKNAAGESVLWGHLSKSNPQWKYFSSGETVMAVFMGPHSYVSSSWYQHLNVPTWNYIAVHVYGIMRLLDEDASYELLKRLVRKYEARSAKPVDVETMPKEFVLKEMKGIVAFEMSIARVEGKWKLSQNRNDEDFASVIRELEALNELNAMQVAGEMKKIRPWVVSESAKDR